MTERIGRHRPMPGGPLQGRGNARLARITQGKRFSRCEINGLR
jgi:hypothetical protein